MAAEDERRSRWRDRRFPSITELTAVVVLLFQLGTIVWFTATVKASVDNLATLGTEMRSQMNRMGGDINDLKVDVGVLKARGK